MFSKTFSKVESFETRIEGLLRFSNTHLACRILVLKKRTTRSDEAFIRYYIVTYIMLPQSLPFS